MRFILLLLALAAWPAVSVAEEPVEVRMEDDWAVASVVVDAKPAEVRALLADGVVSSRLSPTVTEAVRIASDGSCEDIRRAGRAAFSDLDYVVRRCRTETGAWSEELLRSDLMKEYVLLLSAEATGSGSTRVEFRVRTELVLPVPRILVHSELRRSLEATLRSLAEQVGG